MNLRIVVVSKEECAMVDGLVSVSVYSDGKRWRTDRVLVEILFYLTKQEQVEQMVQTLIVN